MTTSTTVDTVKLLLVDGHSLAYRAFYAFALSREGGLRTSTGIPTSVSFGFIKSLLDVLTQEHPTHVAVAFDTRQPTFRHEADDTYKAGRQETPEEFFIDILNLEDLLHALNIPVLKAPGFEADDILGTLAQRIPTGASAKILSGDRDLFQLVDRERGISVLYMGGSYAQRGSSSAPIEYGPAEVRDKLGITPTQVVDYKALCGDSSDNIPGVRGIGAKTAVKLLTEYGSLENVYASLGDMKGAIRKKLVEGEESAKHSQFMARIEINVPLNVEINDLKLSGFEPDAVLPLLQKLEFQAFIRKISDLQQQLGGEAVEIEGEKTERTRPTTHDDDTWFFSAEETETQPQLAAVEIRPQIIDTLEQLEALYNRLTNHTDSQIPVAWDTETTSLNPLDAELVGIGCCWGPDMENMAYIPIGHVEGQTLERELVLETLRPILEGQDYPKTLQNAKYDRGIFHANGIALAGVVFDTMLASYVINPENSHNLSDQSQRHLGIVATSYEDLVPKGKTIADIDISAAANYCGMDVHCTYQLVPILREQIEKIPALGHLLLEVEQPLEPVLEAMEFQGVRIDTEYLQKFSKRLETNLVDIEKQAYESAGETFNLGSPKQLSQLLFEKLELNRKKSRKTKLGYSTDAATLAKLKGDHPVIESILEYRTLSKLKSTYVDALPALVHHKTQRVHTDFNQTVTTTGRLSSSNPNLQNIPIRTAFSRQIRAAFIPEPDWLLVAADYSQIELRILAHLSQEPVLLETYRNNDDVHSLTARLLLEKNDITPEERRMGKVINFGVIYGMGAQRFARETGVSRADAQMFIDRFNKRYPRIFDYLKRMEKEAIAKGYVETILGRRRYFHFGDRALRSLLGSDPNIIDLGALKTNRYDAGLLRAAANAPIQGSSADIIKIAMIKLHEILQPFQARLLLQVHDELVFEMPPAEWEKLETTIQSTMENALALSVPLKVEMNSGPNWMEAK
ncbi:MAG: DNA polymerase I [Cyanobacteria bacterium P01_F01_bin.33]